MSQFHRSGDTLEEHEETTRSTGSRLADFGDRIARAFTPNDRGRVDELATEPGVDPEYELLEAEPEPKPDIAARFPVGPFGYNRASVDQYLIEVERELAELRRQRPGGMSINEEIERLGEQTASILVVAHDQANETTRRAQEQADETTRRAQEQADETTRRAQEQADRCIADAAANAVAITAQAKKQLRELDNETDSVWHERRRLIDDVRTTATVLITLAEEAIERFPEDDKSVTESIPAVHAATWPGDEPTESVAPEAVWPGENGQAPVPEAAWPREEPSQAPVRQSVWPVQDHPA
jgi:cell division septum initiation protein DivIVA